jgi:hypothetical protein
MRACSGAVIKAILPRFQRIPDGGNIAGNRRNSGPAPQAHYAVGEDGGNLGDALLGGHVGGIGWIVDEGHRRSP